MHSIGRISVSGRIKLFTNPAIANTANKDSADFRPMGITTGPDGALWFSNGASDIGRISTHGGIRFYYHDPPSEGPAVIVAGPDGALWFTNWGDGSIGRITTCGKFTRY